MQFWLMSVWTSFVLPTIKYSWLNIAQNVYDSTCRWVCNCELSKSSEKWGWPTVSLVCHQYLTNDEAERGEEVQLHGNGDGQT